MKRLGKFTLDNSAIADYYSELLADIEIVEKVYDVDSDAYVCIGISPLFEEVHGHGPIGNYSLHIENGTVVAYRI
jgi:hypothetical protein